jgi:hypothetical protein
MRQKMLEVELATAAETNFNGEESDDYAGQA